MYEEKIKSFISKINILNEFEDLHELIKSTFLHLFSINEEYANSTLDALLLIADNSKFNIEYSEGSHFTTNGDEKYILIEISKEDNKYALIHELEHIIHYYGARQYDPVFLQELLCKINSDKFIENVKTIIENTIRPIIDKCTRLTTLNKKSKEKNILLNTDENNIKKYMLENEYDNEIIEFVLKSKISLDEYIQLSDEEEENQYAYIYMERLYPTYFNFYGLIGNIMRGRGRVIELVPGIPFTYGHPKEYFEQHDNSMWFSELIATYEEIRANKDVEVINQLLRELLGEELYSKLIGYSKYYRELTINNFSKEEKVVK